MKKLFIFIIIAFVLFTFGCKIKKFTLPTWDVTLRIPLINEKYFVSDLIDSLYFYPSPNNGIIFRTQGEIESDSVGIISIDMDIDSGEMPLLAGAQNEGSINLFANEQNKELAYGVFASGTIRCKFSNMANTCTSAWIVFHEIFSMDNTPLMINYNHNQGWQEISLMGYHIGTQGSATILDNITFTIGATANAPNNTPVGNIQIQLNEPLGFEIFRGRLYNYSLPIKENQTRINIKYPYGLEDAIELQQATINLTLENPMKFDCRLHGDFFAINYGTGRSATAPLLDENGLPYLIDAATDNGPTFFQIDFTHNASTLLSVMPEQIELRNARFDLINPSNNVGEVHRSDKITGDYIASCPLTFILHPALITPRDTLRIEISARNQETIRKNVKYANFSLQVLNKLPIGAEAIVYFSLNPQLNIADSTTYAYKKSVFIHSHNTQPYEQQVNLDLTNEELLIFSNPVVYMKLAYHFEESNGPVTITASPADFIQIRSMMTVRTHVEEQ